MGFRKSSIMMPGDQMMHRSQEVSVSMIIVSSLGHSEEAFRKFRPSHVVSILDDDEPTPPVFDTLPGENHIRLIENCSRGDSANGAASRCSKLVDFARRWAASDSKSPILIHCHLGVARSMAAAFIIACTIEENCSEKEIAERLRKAAPHADPNLLLISEADALLGRNDRMVEAVLDLCPCCSTVSAPIVTLPIAA